MSDMISYELLEYARRAGRMYGVEDFSVFLYSLVRMHKPETMLELGSGAGVCALLCAQAARENGVGVMTSCDDGRQWSKLRERPELQSNRATDYASHSDYLDGLKSRFSLQDHLRFESCTFPPFPECRAPVELLFADFESHPAALIQLLAFYLPRLAQSASLFIDGVPTYLPSYLFLESLIADLNRGKLPNGLLTAFPDLPAQRWDPLLRQRRFTLVHLTEVKDRAQNSTAWIKIEPVDQRPYPLTRMR